MLLGVSQLRRGERLRGLRERGGLRRRRRGLRAQLVAGALERVEEARERGRERLEVAADVGGGCLRQRLQLGRLGLDRVRRAPDAATAAAALAARPARSWQFFALAKLGTEPELVDPDLTVVVADSVDEGLFLPPPPQPAARTTSPATSTAAATCFDLDVILLRS